MLFDKVMCCRNLRCVQQIIRGIQIKIFPIMEYTTSSVAWNFYSECVAAFNKFIRHLAHTAISL